MGEVGEEMRIGRVNIITGECTICSLLTRTKLRERERGKERVRGDRER